MSQKCPSRHFTQGAVRGVTLKQGKETDIMAFPNYHTRSFDRSSQDSQLIHTARAQRHINGTVCTMWCPPWIQIHSIKWKTVFFPVTMKNGRSLELRFTVLGWHWATICNVKCSHTSCSSWICVENTAFFSAVTDGSTNSAPNYHRLQWKGTSD